MGYVTPRMLREDIRQEYNRVKADYVVAVSQISVLGPLQSQLRSQLQSIDDKSSEQAKLIRGQMMSNRLGNNGLRALNKTIRYYYRWCERHGL